MFTVFLSLLEAGIWAEVQFSHININNSNTMLFTASQYFPCFGNLQTLFTGSAKDGTCKALTFFPEKSWYNEATKKLFLQNRYGLYATGDGFKTISAVPGFPSFSTGSFISDGKIPAVTVSPDGTKVLYMKSKSMVSGELYLLDLTTGKSTDLKTDIDMVYDRDYALWSPDSRMFVYSRDNVIYYYSLEQLEGNRVMNEPLRVVGDGKLSSVSWNVEDGSSILYFINGGIVYRLDSSEIFTRSLYNGEFNMSTVTGRVPFDFDSGSDSFTISPDGKRGLIVRKGGDLIIYDMDKTDYRADGKRVRSLPYLQLPRSMKITDLIWSDSGKLVLLAESRSSGTSMVFTQDPSGSKPMEFVQTVDRGIKAMALSPDGKRIVLAGNDGFTLRAFDSWSVISYHLQNHPLNVSWIDNNTLIVSGTDNTTVYNLTDETSFISFFSRLDSSGFTKDGRIVLRQDDGKYLYNDLDRTWSPTGRYTTLMDPVTYTSDYRVYTEATPESLYGNRILIKEPSALQARALFEVPAAHYDPFPAKEEPGTSGIFNHGSRVRARQVALVFNLGDSVEGLPEVLDVLSDYGIKSTFFINGEFIRRHPDAAVELGKSGHEVGSLFYSYFDMSDRRFKIDEDFIRKGLSYNEEEYFSVTGKELVPLWHAPYYFENTDIVSASEKQHYTYIGRDFDTLDWVPSDKGGVLNSLYLNSSDIIKRIIKLKQPGSIIPVTIGRDALRGDYLFDHLDLLIEALKAAGYDLVTVSELIENSK